MKIVEKKNDRKSYLINPSFQLTMVSIFIGISLIVNLIYFFSMKVSFEEFLTLGGNLDSQKKVIFLNLLVTKRINSLKFSRDFPYLLNSSDHLWNSSLTQSCMCPFIELLRT